MELAGSLVMCVVLAIESSLLHTMLTEARRIRDRYPRNIAKPHPSVQGVTFGAPLSPFSARLLDSPELLTSASLRGKPSVLFFVDAFRSLRMPVPQICASVAAMRAQIKNGPVVVVCRGSGPQCRQLQGHVGQCGVDVQEFPVILDDDAALTRQFKVTRGSAAIVLDEQGIVLKAGHQEMNEDASVDAAARVA